MKGFWRSVSAVLAGTALAQVIPILASLVIARLYEPADFGMFSAWLGVVMLIAIVLTGRFETALAIEPDGEPRRIAALSTLITAAGAAALLGLIFFVAQAVAPSLRSNIPAGLLFLALPSALAISASQTLQSRAAADGRYRVLSAMRISEAGAVALAQIVAGLFNVSATALCGAYFLGMLVGLIVAMSLMPLGRIPEGGIAKTVCAFWRRHFRFPLWSLPADAINAAAAQLPVLIVAARFGTDIAGLLAMTMKVLGAPIGLLGKAVLDVFKRRAASSFRERGECRSDYLQTFKVLALGSFIFCLVMVGISEDLFAMAFGERWRKAGLIAVWLLPLFALRFIASPLSYLVYIAGKQHIDLAWQVALFAITLACLYMPNDYVLALKAYNLGYSSLYLIYLAMSYRFSCGEKR